MHFLWGSVLILLLSCLFILIGAFLLKRNPWLLAWLRGTLGMLIIFMGVSFTLALYPLSQFKTLDGKIILADIRASEIEQGTYKLDVQFPDGQSEHFLVRGDTFEFSVLMVDWFAPAKKLGLQKGYSMGFIYYQDMENQTESKVGLQKDQLVAAKKTWKTLLKFKKFLPIFNVKEGKTQPIPLADASEYEIHLTNLGIRFRAIGLNMNAGTQSEQKLTELESLKMGDLLELANTKDLSAKEPQETTRINEVSTELK